MTRDGGIVHRRVHVSREAIGNVSWSPDARRLAYGEFREGSEADVYSPLLATEAAGGGHRRVLTHRGGEYAWSPEGRLAFVALHDGDARLVTASPTGGARRTLVHHAVDVLDWSADGRTIVYRHGDPPAASVGAGGQELWAVNGDGSSARRLVSGARDYGGTSPDGRWILYSRRYRHGLQALWVVRVDGTGRRRLVDRQEALPDRDNTQNDIHHYGWAPGARGVYLTSVWDAARRRSEDHLRLFSLDGRSRDLGGLDGRRVFWSPDGRHVAWADSVSRIRLADGDGTHRRTIARLAKGTEFLDVKWVPDSSALLVDALKFKPD